MKNQLVFTLCVAFTALSAGCEEQSATPLASNVDVTIDSISTDTVAAPETVDAGPEPDLCGPITGLRPQRRSEHAGVYDAEGHQLVIFGGSTGVPVMCGYPTPTFETETWIYDIACDRWRVLDGAAPPGRVRHMAAYDSAERRMIIWGGRQGAPGGGYIAMDDAWALDLETETWSQLPTTAAPQARVNGAFVYDASRHRVILFGGNTSTSIEYIANDDIWTLDLNTNTWAPLQVASSASPSKRLFPAALWDNTRDRMVIYGGSDETAFGNNAKYFDDTWALDFSGTVPTWIPLDDGGYRPPGRFWGRFVYSDSADAYFLFGGHDDGNLGNRNDLHRMYPDSGGWEVVRQGDTYNKPANGFCDFPPDFTNVDMDSPERRSGHIFVGAGDQAWTIAGKTDCGVIDDCFEVDLQSGEWTELTTPTTGETCLRGGGLSCTSMCL